MSKPQNTPTQDLLRFAKQWYKSDRTTIQALIVIIEYHYLFTPNLRDMMAVVYKDLSEYLPPQPRLMEEVYKNIVYSRNTGITENPEHTFAKQAIQVALDYAAMTPAAKLGFVLPEIDKELWLQLQSPLTS